MMIVKLRGVTTKMKKREMKILVVIMKAIVRTKKQPTRINQDFMDSVGK